MGSTRTDRCVAMSHHHYPDKNEAEIWKWEYCLLCLCSLGFKMHLRQLYGAFNYYCLLFFVCVCGWRGCMNWKSIDLLSMNLSLLVIRSSLQVHLVFLLWCIFKFTNTHWRTTRGNNLWDTKRTFLLCLLSTSIIFSYVFDSWSESRGWSIGLVLLNPGLLNKQ